MKNLITIACLVIAMFCFVGCSKKSGTSPKTNLSIEGKWTEDSATFVSYKNSQIIGISREPTPDGSYRQFNSNGTAIDYWPPYQSYPGVSVHITYVLSGSKLTLNYPAFQAGGDSFDPYTDEWTVLTLNEHQLAIKYTDAGVDGTDPANALIQYYYFSR